MERIFIDVVETAAKNRESVPPKVTSELQKSFGKQVEDIAQDRMAGQARKNGLTEEVRQQLSKYE